MLDAIIKTLEVMGWLGVVLGILAITNILTKTLANVWSKEEDFSLSKMLKGIGKVAVFYLSSVAVSIAFTLLPYINEMIANMFDVVLLSNDTLNTLSSVAVLGLVVTAVVVQGKKAIEGISYLSNISTGDNEDITWDVEDE
jgi:hypothetical protein